jgi:hypothetical protein
MQNGGAIKKNKAMQYNIACYPGAAGAVVWVLSVWGFVYYIQPDILLRLPCTAYVGTQATAQALAAGPRVILLALYHGGQAFTPHARTRLLHMPTKPKSKAPQSHPRSCFFRPHARFLSLACRASCWSSVLCPMACGAGSQTLGPNPNSNAPGTQTNHRH